MQKTIEAFKRVQENIDVWLLAMAARFIGPGTPKRLRYPLDGIIAFPPSNNGKGILNIGGDEYDGPRDDE